MYFKTITLFLYIEFLTFYLLWFIIQQDRFKKFDHEHRALEFVK